MFLAPHCFLGLYAFSRFCTTPGWGLTVHLLSSQRWQWTQVCDFSWAGRFWASFLCVLTLCLPKPACTAGGSTHGEPVTRWWVWHAKSWGASGQAEEIAGGTFPAAGGGPFDGFLLQLAGFLFPFSVPRESHLLISLPHSASYSCSSWFNTWVGWERNEPL